MSKDFTPRECWAANSYMTKQTGSGFLDSELAIYNANGEKIEYMSPAERIFRKSVPILGTCFDPLWTWHIQHNDKIGDDIIENCEAILNRYVNAPDDNRLPVKLLPEAWFEGRLDKAFYYNKNNNKALLERMSHIYEANSELQKVAKDIIKDTFIKENLRSGTWTSGSTTTVYPVTIWQHDIDIYLLSDIDGRKVAGWIRRFISKHPYLRNGTYKHADGSTPAHITLLVDTKYWDAGWGL